MSLLYLEDLQPGMRFMTDTLTLDEASLLAFAGQYDPQPFHLDAAAAQASVFAGLAASGWQTCSLSMRLVVTSDFGQRVANGLVGMGVDNLRWPRPTRPGDQLQCRIDILASKRSASQPAFGVVKLRWTTLNQHGDTVMSLDNTIWVAARTATQYGSGYQRRCHLR